MTAHPPRKRKKERAQPTPWHGRKSFPGLSTVSLWTRWRARLVPKTRWDQAAARGKRTHLCQVYGTSVLVRHEKSADRIIAEAAASGQEEMAVGTTRAQQMNSRARYAEVGAAMILAQDDLPNAKLSSLLRAPWRVRFSTRPVIRFSQTIWYFSVLQYTSRNPFQSNHLVFQWASVHVP